VYSSSFLNNGWCLLQVLQSNSGQISSQELVEDLKNVKEAAIRVNPRLMSVGASDQSQAETYGSDVEEEANSYFQKIYIGELTIDDVVDMLQRFNLAPANSYGYICPLSKLEFVIF
jgi:CCR4-NOT transcription complex subunit 1